LTDVKVVIFFSKGSAWLRLTHFLNFLFLSLLIRSGLEILSAHPKLDWMARGQSRAQPRGEPLTLAPVPRNPGAPGRTRSGRRPPRQSA